MTPLGAYPESIPASSTPQSLAEDYLLLMSSFRGGNHPYLEKFQAHLQSLHIPVSKVTGWAQQ